MLWLLVASRMVLEGNALVYGVLLPILLISEDRCVQRNMLACMIEDHHNRETPAKPRWAFQPRQVQIVAARPDVGAFDSFKGRGKPVLLVYVNTLLLSKHGSRDGCCKSSRTSQKSLPPTLPCNLSE